VSVWAQYTIEVDDRDGFRAKLGEAGIPTAVYYPVPIHVQAPYADFPGRAGGLPATEAAMSGSSPCRWTPIWRRARR
jgi:UDP-2-acetamido-2-deoxy-ribo-hexuluronate aminotransferase